MCTKTLDPELIAKLKGEATNCDAFVCVYVCIEAFRISYIVYCCIIIIGDALYACTRQWLSHKR